MSTREVGRGGIPASLCALCFGKIILWRKELHPHTLKEHDLLFRNSNDAYVPDARLSDINASDQNAENDTYTLAEDDTYALPDDVAAYHQPVDHNYYSEPSLTLPTEDRRVYIENARDRQPRVSYGYADQKVTSVYLNPKNSRRGNGLTNSEVRRAADSYIDFDHRSPNQSPRPDSRYAHLRPGRKDSHNYTSVRRY